MTYYVRWIITSHSAKYVITTSFLVATSKELRYLVVYESFRDVVFSSRRCHYIAPTSNSSRRVHNVVRTFATWLRRPKNFHIQPKSNVLTTLADVLPSGIALWIIKQLFWCWAHLLEESRCVQKQQCNLRLDLWLLTYRTVYETRAELFY